MRSSTPFVVTFVLAALVGTQAAAQSSEPAAGQLGSVIAPAAMPPGASSLWLTVGAPELAVGYRQGLGHFEIGATGRVDYLRLALTAEGAFRYHAIREHWLSLAPTLNLGLTGDTGATYFDEDNVAVLSARVHPGLLASATVSELFELLVGFDAPMDFGLTTSHTRVKLLAGVGGELYVGSDVSLSLMIQGGGEGYTTRFGDLVWRPTLHARIGLGVRMF